MTEPDAPAQADPTAATPEPIQAAPEPPAAPPSVPAPRPAARDVLPWLCAIGFIVLAGAIAYVGLASVQRQSQPSTEVQALAKRVAQLEQQSPPPQAADLGPLEARVAALEKRPVPELGPLEARVAALEQQPVPAVERLRARVVALQQQAANASQIAARVDALSAQVAASAGQDRSAEGDLAHRVDAVEARLAALQQSTAATAARLDEAGRLARIAVAQAGLAAGQPLGELPGAPAAVMRFATDKPPTMAALRLSFDHAAQAALEAAQADAGDKPFLAGMLNRAEDLITVRQGDRVLVGNPVAGVLAHARTDLDAGDLAGAVAAIAQLSGPPAAAMANWLADARALLAARTALADMAVQR
ncbi:MAG TPA: mitofilin family membrane protein [Acetobacteraceae bacterium]|jgi:hypothetical protein|nr:mitofilin family membrane protein [Acetobacteraceae bacterium]